MVRQYRPAGGPPGCYGGTPGQCRRRAALGRRCARLPGRRRNHRMRARVPGDRQGPGDPALPGGGALCRVPAGQHRRMDRLDRPAQLLRPDCGHEDRLYRSGAPDGTGVRDRPV